MALPLTALMMRSENEKRDSLPTLRSDPLLLSVEMHEREEDWIRSRSVELFCTTFNTGVLDPTDVRFRGEVHNKWLFCEDSGKANAFGKDVVVINLQEVVDLNNPYNLSYIGDITTLQCVYAWEKAILDILNEADPSRKYKLLASESLVGMAQFVFITEELYDEAFDVRTLTYGCGFMGISGNKGAVGTSFTLFDAPLAFINCHLAAGTGEENREKRRHDLQTILEYARFELKSTVSTMGDQTQSLWNSIPTQISGGIFTDDSSSGVVVGRVSPISLPELPIGDHSPSTVPKKQNSTVEAPSLVSPIADPSRQGSSSPAHAGNVDKISAPNERTSCGSSISKGADDSIDDGDVTDSLDPSTAEALESAHELVVALPAHQRAWRSSCKAASIASREVLSGMHEVVILAGDLNSRLRLPSPTPAAAATASNPPPQTASGSRLDHYEVLRLIDDGHLRALAPYDEVCQMLGEANYPSLHSYEDKTMTIPSSRPSSPAPSLAKPVMFEYGFEEGDFSAFKPTYKYQNKKSESHSNVLSTVSSLVTSTWSLGLEALGVPSSTSSDISGKAPQPPINVNREPGEDDYQRPADWDEYLAIRKRAEPSQGEIEAKPNNGGDASSGEDKDGERSATKGVRVPAWCDRILYCTPRAHLRTRPPSPLIGSSPRTLSFVENNSGGGGGDPLSTPPRRGYKEFDSPISPARVDLLAYSRADLRGSDHRPVNCTYTLHLKAVDDEKENEILTHFERETIIIEAREAKILAKSLNTSAVLRGSAISHPHF